MRILATLPNRQSLYEVLLIFGSGKVVSNSLTVQICQSSSYCRRSDCQSARKLLKGGCLSRSVHAATSKLYPLLWCAFAIEDRPKGLCECPPAGLALVTLDTFASLTVLFMFRWCSLWIFPKTG